MKYKVIINRDEDGVYVAECPSLPGCFSQGRTREKALNHIQDAIKGYQESLKKRDDEIPPPIEEEFIHVTV